jgi:hypothetical protein
MTSLVSETERVPKKWLPTDVAGTVVVDVVAVPPVNTG